MKRDLTVFITTEVRFTEINSNQYDYSSLIGPHEY